MVDVRVGVGLGSNEYGKASLGYLAMKDLLGDAMFKKCLQAYIARWHGKHPTPWDFFYTFNDVSGQNLNWFWTDWYFKNSYVDLAARSRQLGRIQAERRREPFPRDADGLGRFEQVHRHLAAEAHRRPA